MLEPRHIRALTFDCYGTLIDWEAGLLAVLRPWADRHGLTASSDELLARFAEAESASETTPPFRVYRDVLKDVHARLAGAFGVPANDADAAALADSVGEWPAFPDTPAALRALKSRFRLVVVSNVDHASFARTAPRLGVELDGLVTAEDVGAYKPAPAHFHAAMELLAGMGIQKHEALHVAQSLHHDHVPAQRLGLRTAWIDRRAGRAGGATPPPAEGVRPDLRATSLAEFAALMGAAG